MIYYSRNDCHQQIGELLINEKWLSIKFYPGMVGDSSFSSNLPVFC